MYRNIWEMYKKNNSIKFFEMLPPLDLNLIYTKVVELDNLYLCAQTHFQIHALVLRKLQHKTFYYRKCIEIYRKCVDKRI